MWSSVLFVVCVTSLFGTSLSCLECFTDGIYRFYELCKFQEKGYEYTDCDLSLLRIFRDDYIFEAAHVGEGYHVNLSQLLLKELQSVKADFVSRGKVSLKYAETKFKDASINFMYEARKLPRVYGCFPPCGFQKKNAQYNCDTCEYDSCGFPIDCPLQIITVEERSKIQMWCLVQFPLPSDINVIWRYAEQMKTLQMDAFEEVTSGDDTLYSIHSARLHHEGTYQCDIVSNDLSVVRLYFYLIVKPLIVEGHTELQDIFDLSLLPGGRLLPEPDEPDSIIIPVPWLLAACLSSLLLLVVLSLGVLYMSSEPEPAWMRNKTEMKM